MSFVSELRQELVDAAEREQARRMPRVHVPVRRTLLAATAAAALALLVVIAAGSLSTAPDDGPIVAEPTPGARPLFGGEIVPGVRYETRVFVPTLSFVVRDDEWRAAITDRPDVLLLERGEGWFEPGGERRPPAALSFGYIREVYDPSVRGLQASRIPAPTDLYAWLRAHPDLRVGPAEPVTVAGVPGERFLIEVRFDRPTHPDPECRRRWQVTCTAIDPRGSVQTGTLIQMTILETEPDRLVITVEHFTRAGLRDLEEAAAPVLESLRIGVR
jgi:hypothetical protein